MPSFDEIIQQIKDWQGQGFSKSTPTREKGWKPSGQPAESVSYYLDGDNLYRNIGPGDTFSNVELVLANPETVQASLEHMQEVLPNGVLRIHDDVKARFPQLELPPRPSTDLKFSVSPGTDIKYSTPQGATIGDAGIGDAGFDLRKELDTPLPPPSEMDIVSAHGSSLFPNPDSVVSPGPSVEYPADPISAAKPFSDPASATHASAAKPASPPAAPAAAHAPSTAPTPHVPAVEHATTPVPAEVVRRQAVAKQIKDARESGNKILASQLVADERAHQLNQALDAHAAGEAVPASELERLNHRELKANKWVKGHAEAHLEGLATETLQLAEGSASAAAAETVLTPGYRTAAVAERAAEQKAIAARAAQMAERVEQAALRRAQIMKVVKAPVTAVTKGTSVLAGGAKSILKNTRSGAGRVVGAVGAVAGVTALAGTALALGAIGSARSARAIKEAEKLHRFDAMADMEGMTSSIDVMPTSSGPLPPEAQTQLISQPTLMGMPLVKNGPHGMRVMAGRGQIPGQSVDAAPPSIISPQGVNTIDGSSGIQTLNRPG